VISDFEFQTPACRQAGVWNSKSEITNKFYETININNAKFARDFSLINSGSKLPELRNYSKAYLHHLFKLNEPLGQKLASLNNLEFYMNLMVSLKKSY